MNKCQHLIRDIPDFPKPGIGFKDITPLLADGAAFARTVQCLAQPLRALAIDKIAGIEARGFILGAALALELGVGFVPLRKPGKLPGKCIGIDYALEYGNDRLELHSDAFAPGERAALIDDVLATGGTLVAARRLLESAGAQVAAGVVLFEIAALGGRARWPAGSPLHALLRY